MDGSKDFLGLANVRTTNIAETDETIIVEAETIEPDFPKCGLFCELKLNGNRQKRRLINDTPHGGKAVLIHMRVRRAKCITCKAMGIYEVIPHVQPKRHMTARLATYIAREGLKADSTHSGVGRHVYVTEGTARSIVHDYIDAKIGEVHRETPRVLGIDEKKLVGQFRAVLGNIEELTVLNMLPDRDASLAAYIKALPNKERIEVVCIDQYDGYRLLIKQLLPGRAIVTDRFHIVRRANQALDKIRAGVAANLRTEDARQGARLRMSRTLFWCRANKLSESGREAIERWTTRYPILHDAYWAKERFFDMYNCASRMEAIEYYKDWGRSLPPTVADHFIKLAKIHKRWLPHVFDYFDHPYTTGYVESVNRGLNAMQAAGRGYSFEVIRGKLMLAEKLEKKTFRDRSPGKSVASPYPIEPLETFNWGVDLDRLHRALTARSYHVKKTADEWIRTDDHHGLATIEPSWAMTD